MYFILLISKSCTCVNLPVFCHCCFCNLSHDQFEICPSDSSVLKCGASPWSVLFSHFKGSWYLLILCQAVHEEFLDTLTFEMSGTTCSVAHHYTSEVLNLKYGIVIRGVNFYTGVCLGVFITCRSYSAEHPSTPKYVHWYRYSFS